jgi:hypothetical protein
MFLNNYEIPVWIEFLAIIVMGIIFGSMFALSI